jgi:hypothetical protein
MARRLSALYGRKAGLPGNPSPCAVESRRFAARRLLMASPPPASRSLGSVPLASKRLRVQAGLALGGAAAQGAALGVDRWRRQLLITRATTGDQAVEPLQSRQGRLRSAFRSNCVRRGAPRGWPVARWHGSAPARRRPRSGSPRGKQARASSKSPRSAQRAPSADWTPGSRRQPAGQRSFSRRLRFLTSASISRRVCRSLPRARLARRLASSSSSSSGEA